LVDVIALASEEVAYFLEEVAFRVTVQSVEQKEAHVVEVVAAFGRVALVGQVVPFALA
jgi:hypothetical protein